MTIVREPRAAKIEAVYQRAMTEGGQEFAESLCNMIETYRTVVASVAAGYFPTWPRPAEARRQVGRILDAAGELLGALHETSEAVRARLDVYRRMESARHGGADGSRLIPELSVAIAAAARIRREQPATKRPNETREGFLLDMRQIFEARGIGFTATASESAHTNDTYTSLAVDAVMAACDLSASAARKAIRDLQSSRGKPSRKVNFPREGS